MKTDQVTKYRGLLIRSIVTPADSDRYRAAAIVTDPTGETRTLGVDGDFAEPNDAHVQATELAIAWIDGRHVVSDHYVRRG
ncbi:hypothetical protein FSB08_18775 [Paraburkholderia sp. JPY432]|uniref:hypothetical protein n=1 Tax=Paraburkholderia youngii TaxID=2782701 RepID=UPI001595A762|nr:hypothetical protein [Paraburkholderia youngii]NVH74527.1 hypothetical protein [Paraburkholderia youngii]